MGKRDDIDTMCRTYLPDTEDRNSIVHWHQIGFDNIAKDYGQGSGTTCGFLPHWLLWRLGCTDADAINRSVPERGFKFRIGQNLSIFAKHPACVRVDGPLATRMAKNTGGPKKGDFIIIRGGFWKNKETGVRDLDSAHIMVLLDVKSADGTNVEWRVAQSGVSNDALQQGGHIRTLKGKLRQEAVKEADTDVPGPNLVFVADILGEEVNFPRRVSSYINVDAIACGAKPDGAVVSLLDARRSEATRNDPKTVYPWLGWYEESNPGGFILPPAYILLERGHEATRFTRQGLGAAYALDSRGVWKPNGRLEIQWREGRRQTWDLKKSFVPKEQTTGTPVEGNGGTLTWRKKMPDEVPTQWASAHLFP
jgi:hypothetical protein